MTDSAKSRRVKNPVLVAALVTFGAVVVYELAVPRRSDAPSASASAPEPAPALSVPGLDGKPVALADHKGQDFALLGVSMDEEGAAAVKKFTAKQPIDYPVGLNGGERAPKGWLVPGLPTAYLIGRDGSVLKRWFGEKDMTELRAAIDAALEKK